MKEEGLQVNGVVVESIRGAFIVKLDDVENKITAHLGGKLRKNNIKVVEGDAVTVELSQYDLTKGRIVYRK
jgi:translation initiation factor IF-1